MRILFIHEVDYLGKPIYEIQEFPECLAARGHEITFLEFNESKRTPRSKRSRVINGRVLLDQKIRLETPFFTGWENFDRLLAVVTCVPKLFSLLREGNFDIVVLYAVPTYGIQALVLSKLFGIPVVHRALDVPNKIRRSIYAPLIKVAERFVYKFAPIISANNAGLAEYCDRVGSRRVKSLVHLPPLDIEKFSKVSNSEALAKELGILPTDQVIAYLGSFFYFSGLPNVMHDFSEASKLDPSLKLLLIGGGEQEKLLKNLATNLNIHDKVVFTGFIPFVDIGLYLSLAKVAINPMESVLAANAALPHKVFQYIASGIPVVSTRLIGLHSTLGEDSGVTWVQSPNDVMTASTNLLKNSSLRMQNNVQAAATIHKLFDRGVAVERFEEFLEDYSQVAKR